MDIFLKALGVYTLVVVAAAPKLYPLLLRKRGESGDPIYDS
jgi:hypothetical protein